MRHFGRLAGLAAAMGAVSAVSARVEPQAVVRQVERGPRVQVMEGPRESNLNRSRHWDHAETYKEARMMSPVPWKPVR